ncbi:hypothetical protein L873DRAFT_1801794 [Choiromyces venosus 120613-1]|uniref:Uncharacterized protein n=1 Tax=Choiromyces venosus 120613-1 TaxID=1336337 RepID=A0A3N4JZU4_9PEZI|nr:hypothetical protein L873DRAFT_1801794 [Choiromyces venosus 120613-1]
MVLTEWFVSYGFRGGGWWGTGRNLRIGGWQASSGEDSRKELFGFVGGFNFASKWEESRPQKLKDMFLRSVLVVTV